MAEIVLPDRAPLAHGFIPGTHGVHAGGVGVTLTAKGGVACFAVFAKRSRLPELAQAAQVSGLALPAPGLTVSRGRCHLLWSGPEQWTLIGDRAEAEQFAQAWAAYALVVDQSDGRAFIAVAGPRARATLAKGVPLDLHPRVFKLGMTAVTTAAGIAIQIWQTEETSSFELALPRSFVEDFWAWLTHAAAEYGYEIGES